MFITRALSRASAGRVVVSSFLSARTLSTRASPAFRPLATATAPTLRFPLMKARFSTGVRFLEKEGTVDEELVAKIHSELSLEQQDFGDEMPRGLKEFLDNSLFEVHDKPGEEEVELTRKFGDEIIRVEFSIADLDTSTNPDDLDENALFDDASSEDDHHSTTQHSSGSNSAPSKSNKSDGSSSFSRAATNQLDDGTDDTDEFDDDQPASFPSRVNVTIEKAHGGALQFEAIAQDGMIVIENVHYHRSADLATAKTVSADWERRGLYAGPPFSNLDEDLQVLLERYLDERGINTALALFIPDYIDWKEQREYVSWLSNVKDFVES